MEAVYGNAMPVTKIGDIRMPGRFTIPSVCLVPGIKADGLISVRQLAIEAERDLHVVRRKPGDAIRGAQHGRRRGRSPRG